MLGLASGLTLLARGALVVLLLTVEAAGCMPCATCELMSPETFPVASICIRLEPTESTSPTFAPRDLTTPVTGAGISI
ncbi:unannotated protein [freshwater metagenome]|uniref:Unannotated protein n=1 Tax=freshwater metagenome TaxID=449393 RepID=A0A6J6QZA5_9ZZZZ